MKTEIEFPTLHPAQIHAFRLFQKNRYVAVRCGRRWGKTDLGKVIACDGAIRGEYIFWGAPAYKYIAEAFVEIARTLQPIVTQSSKIDGVIRTSTGGRIDFWSLDNERAGASRRYHKAIIDEAAFTKNSVMLDIWQRSIKPTLLDYQGKAIVLSNANGNSQKNFFYQICTNPIHNFIEYHSPSMDNPHVPKRETGESDEEHQKRRDAEFELLKVTNTPLVFAQEYLADFVDWSGKSLFDIRNMLAEDGQAFDFPARCDYVFATIDSATKTGKKHDGTAVSMWAYSGYAPNSRNLLLLDWDIVQISGDLLINWLPTVFQSLDMYAKQCGARVGSFGAYIEDAASGMILLQQAQRLGYPVEAIDSKLTSVGKTERALNVSGHVYCGSVGISKNAHDKQTMYHGNMHNHWEYQVGQFKVGDTDPLAEDDLLDTATYGIAIALGDSRFGDA